MFVQEPPGGSTQPERKLAATGLSKAFGHVRALKDVDVELDEGEILAIVGDNGAGKSTLIKILSGALQPDAGEFGRRPPSDFPQPALGP